MEALVGAAGALEGRGVAVKQGVEVGPGAAVQAVEDYPAQVPAPLEQAAG